MEYKEKSNCIKDSVYIDDGYSGTSMERPGMQRLLKEVKDNQIGCVIVKDDCVILELNSESPENTQCH